jgi:hypothetical protein
MKKLVLAYAIFAIAGGAAHAEFSLSAELNAIWDAFQYVKPAPELLGEDVDPRFAEENREERIVTGFGRAGGGSYETVLHFNGSLDSGVAGLYMGLYYQGGTPSISGRGWLKPFEWLRVDLGKVKVNDLIKLPLDFYPRLDSYMLKAGRDPDIFTNFEENNSLLFRLTPNENLFIGLFLFNQALLSMGENASARPMIGGEDPKHAFQRVQATVGYTIPNVGTARLQYRGANPDVNDDTMLITTPRLEAAFAFTGVPDLTIDLGMKYLFFQKDPQIPARRNESAEVQGIIPIPAWPAADSGTNSLTGTKELPGSYQAPQQMSFGIDYKLRNIGPGTLGLGGRFDLKYLGWYQKSRRNIVRMGPEIKASLWPSYQLDNWTFQVETTIVYGADWTAYGRTLYRGGLGLSCGAFAQRRLGSGNSLTVGLAVSGGEGLVLPKLGASENPATLNTFDNTARISTPWDRGVLPVVFSIPVKFSIRI